jgi:hypothetical protein
MAYLSLLFASAVRGTPIAPSLSRQTEDEHLTEFAWPNAGEEDTYEDSLPLGIASMEHWLDLNA